MDDQTLSVIMHAPMYACIAGIGYIAGLAAIYELGSRLSSKVRSQEELDEIVESETKKLQFRCGILAQLTQGDMAQCEQTSYGYRIKIGGKHANIATVRHEVYHIFKKHPRNTIVESKKSTPRIWRKTKMAFQRSMQILRRYLRDEPQAIAYSCLGIKI